MRIALAGLAALAVAMGIGRFAFTPLLPMMQADSGLSLAAGAGSPRRTTWLSPRRAVRRFCRSFTAAHPHWPVGDCRHHPGHGFTHQLVVWAALRLAAGIASAWVLVHVSAWCLPRLPGRRTLAGALYAGVGVASWLRAHYAEH